MKGWGDRIYDCYYANVFPDWGPRGREGNPSFDIDDINGAGPERLSLNLPENDVTYKMGVVYFNMGASDTDPVGFGSSDATVRIYIFGQLEGEWTRRLNATGNFWEVAGVIWRQNEKRVQEINRYYDAVP